MAVGTSFWTLMSTWDTALTPEDVNAGVSLVAKELTLLARVGLAGFTAMNTTHQYTEMADRVARTTVATAATASATTIVFADAVFSSDEEVRIGTEVIKLGSTTDNLTFTTCSRSVNTGSAAALSAGDVAVSLGKPRKQGVITSVSTGDRIVEPVAVTNYTQIFRKDIIISRTAKSLPRYGVQSSKFDDAAQQQFAAVTNELEEAIFMGKARAPTSSVGGKLTGLFERINAASHVTDKSAAAISIDNIEDAVAVILDYEKEPSAVYCGTYSARVFNHMPDSIVQHNLDNQAPNDLTYGQKVSRLYVNGASLDIVRRPKMYDNLAVISEDLIKVGPLIDGQFKIEPLAKTGDADAWMVIGEYTCELPAAAAGHYWFSNVKAS